MQVDDLFEKKLEQLQNGASLEVSAADLPQEDAELLSFAGQLRDAAYPEPDRAMVEAQRERVLRLAEKEIQMSSQHSIRETGQSRKGLPRWVLPTILAGGAVLTLACVFVLVVGGTAGLWLSSRQESRVSQATVIAPSVVVKTPPAVVVQPTAMPTRVGKPVAVEPVEIPDAQTARIDAGQGLVQVLMDDGSWIAVPANGQLVQVGQRVRSGMLSSTNLVFYDGSVVTLGPNTEVSMDELDARLPGEPRVVVLTQWVGETTHDVVSSAVDGSRYEVNTPSGSGAAKGTKFYVLVTPLLVRFNVDEGVVAVTNVNVTVIVVAGQTTEIAPNVPPTEPYLRVSGEGQVSRTGETWKIAGQTFATHAQTIIVGNPQVGDWVWVEGHLLADEMRVADRIVLLRRSPENRFSIQGAVETIGDEAWMVSGQTISVTAETAIDEGIVEGNEVLVQGHIKAQGGWVAEQITSIEELPGLPFEFVGVVQAMGDETWTVSGVVVSVDENTAIGSDLEIGAQVKVEGFILGDESWLAAEIRLVSEDMDFEFTGAVESLDPWIVSGIGFVTETWTEIDEGTAIGDQVKVSGQILDDGTWVAGEIIKLDEGVQPAVYIEFVGRITGMDPWSISGIPVVVDDQTEIKGNARLGVRVRVKALVLPDGTLLARQIKAVGFATGQGCLNFGGIVTSIDDEQIKLHNGLVIPLNSVVITGEIDVGALVLLLACVDEDGTMTFVDVVVIYQLDPDAIPWPTPLPIMPVQTPPPADGDLVTICHKPGTSAQKTMTVTRDALSGHLGHGDTLGPCQPQDDDDDDDEGDDD